MCPYCFSLTKDSVYIVVFVAGPLLLQEAATSAGRLAYVCVRQLEAPTLDEKLAKQVQIDMCYQGASVYRRERAQASGSHAFASPVDVAISMHKECERKP